MLHFEYDLIFNSQSERSIGCFFFFLFFSEIPFQVCIQSWMWAILENIKSGGEDVRLNLQALITRFSYLSPHTTIKMLDKLWRKGIDAHSPKQMNVSKLVPIHHQRALWVSRYDTGEWLLAPCLQKWQAVSWPLVRTCPPDNSRALSIY